MRSGRSISTSPPEQQLLCRSCDLPHGSEERFCRSCGRPLVQAGDAEAPANERTRHARKIHPSQARGEPQRVAVVQNLAEGELVQGILLEEGIPSILRRTGGFDVPDMLAAGPRDVMVPASGAESARALLGSMAPELHGDDALQGEARPNRVALKLAAALLVALLLFGAIAGGGYTLFY